MQQVDTTSVSKGVFLFKNNFKSKKLSRNLNFSNDLWYEGFRSLWFRIYSDIEAITSDTFSSMINDLINFVKSSHRSQISEIPSAALLTGINVPDHENQFNILRIKIKKQTTPHLAILKSESCSSVKLLIEYVIDQFINEIDEQIDITDDFDDVSSSSYKIKKSQLNLTLLECWYENLYKNKQRKPLVVMIPNFESFNMNVLQKFILIVSFHITKLPFVLIFGVATQISTLYTSFPYHVSSKISVQMFQCDPPNKLLDKVLEDVFLTRYCPFQLGAKVFNLFMDIFLFYDFSIHNFVQNIKYAMMEHFSTGNAKALCSFDVDNIKLILDSFEYDDCENVRQLLSFRNLVQSETYENRIKLLTDDNYFKQILLDNLINFHKYLRRFYLFLKCLHVLVADLPGYPLGKQFRQLYAIAIGENITNTPQYKECFQLLNFQSKKVFTDKLKALIGYLSKNLNLKTKKTQLKVFYTTIHDYITSLDNLDENILTENDEKIQKATIETDSVELNQLMDRKTLRETLLSRTKPKSKQLNKYEKLRNEILQFISEMFQTHLTKPSSYYFHEIFIFDDILIQNKIIGMHRSAIHTALNDPWNYLECSCCEISNSNRIKPTMPDICIVYKLHLECGKLINMYDWLQAFLYIVDPQEVDDELNSKAKKVVDPHLQARFTQAVAELEFLGFIKSSKKKTDHVIRLTWGR